MKRSNHWAATIGLLFAMPAMAQSNVSLYGVIDEGTDYTNNAGTGAAWKMQSGDALTNRWGLKGVEDLGGGLQALFQVENGFDASSGSLAQPNRMFGRQAFAGLSDSRYGTVTLGRQYDSVVDFVAPLTANGSWGGYLFSHPLDNDNTDDTFGVGNAVKYLSPTYGDTFCAHARRPAAEHRRRTATQQRIAARSSVQAMCRWPSMCVRIQSLNRRHSDASRAFAV